MYVCVCVSAYKRVYPNWRPGTSLEQTDVVGTIEALTGRWLLTVKP